MTDEIDTYKSKDPFADPVLNKRHCLTACDQFKWGDNTLVAKFRTRKI